VKKAYTGKAIITMTKQHTAGMPGAVPAELVGAGAPAGIPVSVNVETGTSGDQIVTTRQRLVDSIHEAVEECFSDERVSGPAPPRTVVFRLVGEVLARVSPPGPQVR
jgi:hypothetical protein